MAGMVHRGNSGLETWASPDLIMLRVTGELAVGAHVDYVPAARPAALPPSLGVLELGAVTPGMAPGRRMPPAEAPILLIPCIACA